MIDKDLNFLAGLPMKYHFTPEDGERVGQILAQTMHCSTCQCVRVHDTPRIPGNPLSRSWHGPIFIQRELDKGKLRLPTTPKEDD